MFIVHHPGMIPRIGHPIGDVATSLREWKEHNPGAAIYVLQAYVLPSPGTASVQTADEYLWMEEALEQAYADAEEEDE